MEEGEEISLSDFEGEVVVLNAWGQWCAPCRAEVDDLQLVQETLDPLGGTVLGINVRDRGPGWTYRWCTSCSARSIAG